MAWVKGGTSVRNEGNSAGVQRQDELLETNPLLKVVAHCIERGKFGLSPIFTLFAPIPDAPNSKPLTGNHDYPKSAPLELLLHAMLLVSNQLLGFWSDEFGSPNLERPRMTGNLLQTPVRVTSGERERAPVYNGLFVGDLLTESDCWK